MACVLRWARKWLISGGTAAVSLVLRLHDRSRWALFLPCIKYHSRMNKSSYEHVQGSAAEEQIAVIKVLIFALIMKYGPGFVAFAFHASCTGAGYDLRCHSLNCSIVILVLFLLLLFSFTLSCNQFKDINTSPFLSLKESWWQKHSASFHI